MSTDLRAFSLVLPEAYLLVSDRGEILIANPAAERLIGRSRAEVEGRSLFDFVPGDPDGLQEYLRSAGRTTGPVTGALVLHGADGSERPCVCLGGAIVRPGNGTAAQILLRVEPRVSATSRFRLLNDQIDRLSNEVRRRRRAERDLQVAKEEAESANRAKSDFVATVSHELRTPLSAIIGYSELLKEGVPEPIGEGARNQVDRIALGARHLQQLIEEILSFSRLEAGRERLDIRVVRLDELVDEVRAVIEPLATRAGLGFGVDADYPREPLRTDPRKLRQILLNLLGNAIKFTERGEVRLEIGLEDDLILFRIADTGIGIEPHELDRLFEPFWQADASYTREAGGTGLGLSISQHLARLLGGSISADSEGRGSTFTLSLPFPSGVGLPDSGTRDPLRRTAVSRPDPETSRPPAAVDQP